MISPAPRTSELARSAERLALRHRRRDPVRWEWVIVYALAYTILVTVLLFAPR